MRKLKAALSLGTFSRAIGDEYGKKVESEGNMSGMAEVDAGASFLKSSADGVVTETESAAKDVNSAVTGLRLRFCQGKGIRLGNHRLGKRRQMMAQTTGATPAATTA